jgi:NADPH:quinone reductase-like Zn-dependent oxidoreductase
VALQKVVRSTVIDAPLERVWAVLRDFNSHDSWHDVVEASRIEDGQTSSEVGCVRNFTLKDGNRIREQLLTLDDVEHRSTYAIVEATVPLQRYVAAVTLKRVTDGDRTFWHWESTFDTPPGRERELRDMVAHGVYEAGFANLRRHLALGGDLQPQRPNRSMVSATGAAAAASVRASGLAARQVQVPTYGDASVLRLGEGVAPPPGPDEVRIRQTAIGVNFFDVYLRRGWIPAMLPLNATAPAVLGMEAAGSVIDAGEAAGTFLPGDRVAYLGPAPGAYASVRTVPASWLVRLPPEMPDETAAALLLKGITADVLLRDLGRVGPGTRLLVHAAAGALGTVVASWAASLGAIVTGTVSSEAKARVAREHGCRSVVVVPRDGRFADAVQRQTGGADVIVDGLGRDGFEENWNALAPRGHWISVGQASGALPAISADRLVEKSATFSRPVVFAYVGDPASLAERAARVFRAHAEGAIRLPPVERYAIDAAARAHERLEARLTTGALVLVP